MLKILVSGLLTILPVFAFADEHAHHHEDHNENHEHKAHQHGIASLNWVVEDKTLALSLDSPAMNIVGFEHAPSDEHEKKHVEQAMALLQQSNNVVVIKGGNCELNTVNVDSPFLEAAHEHVHEAEHADISAEYVFFCGDPAGLKMIDVRLFETFSSFEKIESQWIINNTQGAASLTHENYRIQIP